MPTDLSDTLVIGISATALFDLSEADSLFRELAKTDPDKAIDNYRKYMLEKEDFDLEVGTGYPLVKSLLNLNKYQKDNEAPLVEVVVMSRNSPETGLRVLKCIRKHGLAISRSAFTAGESSIDYIDAYDVDLFLTTNSEDAQQIINSGVCAAAVLSSFPKDGQYLINDQVRIAFDGDAVLFDEESEVVYKKQGLAAFHQVEAAKQDIPLKEGPYASFLKKLSRLQERLPIRVEYSPIRIALVTARNSPADIRVINTLRTWGVYVDEAFFLGGLPKGKILKAFKAHIYFEDQDSYLRETSDIVPSGKVLYKTDSEMNNLNNQ